MSNFLLELLVEEIPARFQANAIKEFEKLIVDEFDKVRVSYKNVRSFITPRRMIFSADLEEKTQGFQEEKRGPQVTAPTEIIERFLEANNASRENCVERDIDKKTFVVLLINHTSKDTISFLPDIIRKSIIGLPWKKSMHWGTHRLHFVRPIRNILAMFGEKIVDLKFDEIGLQSTDHTFGHRFMAPAAFSVKDYDDYRNRIRENFVIIDREERKKIILEQVKNIETKYGVSVVIPSALLEEVVGLTEYPVVLIGKIPDRFMKMPKEVIATPMEVHQRYFSTRDKTGELAPYFVFVANNIATDGGVTIINGNERVLNARLADALFFFETDLKNPLDSNLESLKKIEFNEKLGSVFSRIQRLESLCQFAFDKLKVNGYPLDDEMRIALSRAVVLSKCDLSSNIVREFPELQGIIGARYAKIQGEAESVCQAIEDQYKSGNEVTSLLSALFFLIDKVEIISSLFAIGKEPTGSKDPFALRRAAINLIKVIRKYEIQVDLCELIEKAISQLPGIDLNPETTEKICDFIMDRLKVVLKDECIDHSIVSTLVKSDTDVLEICQKASILNEFVKTAKGEKLISLGKRTRNIVADNDCVDIDESLFTEKEEIDLYNAIKALDMKLINIRSDNLSVMERHIEETHACLEIEECVSLFFDKVLVASEDQAVHRNRLNLVTKLTKMLNAVLPIC